ncbi:MAG: 16S rRNA (adenine(1518)-N(6)/adenine(1519)-N(6))-dimethyltransferase RsmA [Saccharofermentanales bacterium]|jgi:16S rRNA (adenine1518-N6/adenine1519-N6)-dimethyltransferase|nr:ribosomal RNA small subunit methyltransferase A [Clostridiaceae bacterium]
MNRKQTLDLLRKYDIRPTRSLGQNFLVDESVVVDIGKLAELGSDDLVVEIGAGVGGLTEHLARRAGAVCALEIDAHVLPALRAVLHGFSNCTIIHADALQVNLTDLVAAWPGQVKVVANLPYYITTPLIKKILIELPGCSALILMLQKEAADRILAPPMRRAYGPVAVLTACFGTASRKLKVPADAFFPRPNIDSVIIQVVRADQQFSIADWEEFHLFLERCFAHRRKTLANSLKNAGLSADQLLNLPAALARLELDPDVRADHLTHEQLAALYALLTIEL